MLIAGVPALVLFLFGMSEQLDSNTEWRSTHELAFNMAIEVAASERGGHTKMMEANGKTLETLLKIVEDERARLLTIDGKGLAGDFGADDAFIRINRQSGKVRYHDGERVRVTLTGDNEGSSIILPINGTFTHSNRDLVLVFSRKACGDLGVTGTVEVSMAPAE